MSKLTAITMASALGLTLSACGDGGVDQDEVSFDIMNSAGLKIGILEIEDDGAEGIELEVSLSGIEPGMHAMHFHETGRCDAPDYKTSGGHYNPDGVAHGQVDDGPHAGDMMNIEIGADGTGTFEVDNDKLSLRGTNGLPALMDADGSALIVHAKADDYKSQPSGAAGPRIACAVIAEP